MNDSLKYVELSEAHVSDIVLAQFDCGNNDMSDYLRYTAIKDASIGLGVTYILVREQDFIKKQIRRIYAYATLKTHSLNYFDSAEKFHTKEADENGNVLLSIPCIEIKMFAIDKALRGQVAYGLNSDHRYSTVFFTMLLEMLYFMSMTVIGFQIIFLRANVEGELLYRSVDFSDCTDYLVTYDSMAEGCKPLFLTLNELEYILYS